MQLFKIKMIFINQNIVISYFDINILLFIENKLNLYLFQKKKKKKKKKKKTQSILFKPKLLSNYPDIC